MTCCPKKQMKHLPTIDSQRVVRNQALNLRFQFLQGNHPWVAIERGVQKNITKIHPSLTKDFKSKMLRNIPKFFINLKEPLQNHSIRPQKTHQKTLQLGLARSWPYPFAKFMFSWFHFSESSFIPPLETSTLNILFPIPDAITIGVDAGPIASQCKTGKSGGATAWPKEM